MSSSAPGKFQDHYALLGVDPRADLDTIRTSFNRLAEKYRPDNPATGDADKFESVSIAFEVLSDPDLRASFDKLKGIGNEDGKPQFSGMAFFNQLRQSTHLRAAVLCILYDLRRSRPFKPSISIRNLEGMLRVTSDEMVFAMTYLKQRSLVVNDDKSSVQITVDGMDFLEKNPPDPEEVLRFIRPASMADAAPPPENVAELPGPGESGLQRLNRALLRKKPTVPESEVV
jgi:curved DNA-binding protein CbpA